MMTNLPATIYISRGPNEGEYAAHDLPDLGGVAYVPKPAPVAAGGVDTCARAKPDWENFGKAITETWPTGDFNGADLFDLCLTYGLIEEVPGGYNPDLHIDADGVCPETGDPWYEYTFRGAAGPGLYSITAISADLEAMRAERDAALARVVEMSPVLEKMVKVLNRDAPDARTIAWWGADLTYGELRRAALSGEGRK